MTFDCCTSVLHILTSNSWYCKTNMDTLLCLSSKVYLACVQVPQTGLPLRSLTKRPFANKENHIRHFSSISNLLSNSQRSMRVQHLKLRWRKLDSLANNVGGARNIFLKLFGKSNAEETFWLDSSSTEKVCCNRISEPYIAFFFLYYVISSLQKKYLPFQCHSDVRGRVFLDNLVWN